MTVAAPRATTRPSFPHRDEAGRVASLRELVFAGAAWTVVALIGLTAIDGLIALMGLGRFGSSSGWLAMILPALLFFDDLRAWRGYGARFLVALVGAAIGIGLGLIVAALVPDLPALLGGGLAALVAAVTYALIWFTGIRWLTGNWRRSS